MKKAAAVILSAALLAAGAGHAVPEEQTAAPAETQEECTESGDHHPAEGDRPLFEDLREEDVNAVSIVTKDDNYEFRRKNGEVSLNGQEADSSSYRLLIEEIANLPIRESEPSGKPGDTVLTITVYFGETSDRIVFTEDENEHDAEVACTGLQGNWSVEGWSLGKLMLICEGAKIQNDEGQETPVQE